MNKLLEKLSQKQMKKLLLIFIFIPIYAQFTQNYPNSVCDIFSFAYTYLLVGYIKKYGNKFIEKYSRKPWYLFLIFMLLSLAFLTNYLTEKNKILDTIGYIIMKTIGNTRKHSIILLLISILMVFNVLNKKPKYCKGVNKVASHTLGVYLFHENLIYNLPLVTTVIITNFSKIGIFKMDTIFPLRFLGIILFVFIIGTMLETICCYCIQKPIMKYITKKYDKKLVKIDNYFNSL